MDALLREYLPILLFLGIAIGLATVEACQRRRGRPIPIPS